MASYKGLLGIHGGSMGMMENRMEIIYFEHPHPKAFIAKMCNVSLPPFLAALQTRCKNIDTLLLGTPGILRGWALEGYFSVGPCRDIWWLGTAGILCGWAI